MKKKVYVVIDVQNDFITGSLGSKWADKTTNNIKKYLSDITEQDPEAIIVATRDTHYSDYSSTLEGQKLPVEHCIYGSKGWNLDKRIEKFPIHIIDKVTFASKELPATLCQLAGNIDNIEEIIIFGFVTSICVISNALYLRGNFPNTKITLIPSLCADVNNSSHEAACTVMKNCQIDISDFMTERLTSSTSGNYTLDAIIRLIKDEDFSFTPVDDDIIINENTNLTDDLHFDSLDNVTLLMLIEEHFSIEISDDEAIEIKTVGDIINIIKANARN